MKIYLLEATEKKELLKLIIDSGEIFQFCGIEEAFMCEGCIFRTIGKCPSRVRSITKRNYANRSN